MSGSCPCCKQPIDVPSLEDAIASARLDGFEASILRAVWSGKGHPVLSERVFDEMYADDVDGGPSPTRMYAALHGALARLNSKLNDTGVAIQGVGYRKGWRLALGDQSRAGS